MESHTIDELINEKLISPKAKLETFIITNLNLRPASQITVPAELPYGVEM